MGLGLIVMRAGQAAFREVCFPHSAHSIDMAVVPRVILCAMWSVHSPSGATAHCHVTYRIRGRLQRKGVFSCRRTLTPPRIGFGYACAVSDCDSHTAAAWDVECLSDMTGWEALPGNWQKYRPVPLDGVRSAWALQRTRTGARAQYQAGYIGYFPAGAGHQETFLGPRTKLRPRAPACKPLPG